MAKDPFRDTPIRYLGYANEIGEAFRTLIPPRAVWLSYGVACGYVGCDSIHKGLKAYSGSSAEPGKRHKHAVLAAGDALVWQSLASVAVPGFTINRICWATRLALKRLRQPALFTLYVPVGVGLASIPFIITPIDNAVDYFMDLTLRPWIFKR